MMRRFLLGASLAAILAGPLEAQVSQFPQAPGVSTPVSVANGGTGTGSAGNTALNNILGYTHIASGKSPAFNNSVTIAGTDSTTMTFPSSSATVAGLGIANVFTADQEISESLSHLFINNTGNTTGYQCYAFLSGGGVIFELARWTNSCGSQTSILFKFDNTVSSDTWEMLNTFNVNTGAAIAANARQIGYGTATASCTVPTGAGGSPVCTVTHTAGSFAGTFTFSGGTGSFSGSTFTVTFGTAAPSLGYLCIGRDMAANLNLFTTAYTSTTVSTLTFYTPAGVATAPGLTDVVTLSCAAE